MTDQKTAESLFLNIISNNIRSRHSTRFFISKPISDDDLKGILAAGILAPSSKNRQPWRIIVLRGDDVRDLSKSMSNAISEKIQKLDDEELIEDHKMALMTMDTIEKAPVLLVIGYQDSEPYHNAKMMDLGMTDRKLVDVLSIGACIENILLESEERGICSLWIGDYLYANETVMDILKPDFDIVSMVALGYPAKKEWTRSSRCDDRIDYR